MATQSKSAAARMSQNSSSIIAAIYKSRATILDQLQTQGYVVDEYIGFSVNEVNSMYQASQLDMLLTKETPTEEIKQVKTYIRYYLAKKLLQGNIQEMIDDLFTYEGLLTKNDNLIIIIKDEPNDTLVQMQKQIWDQDRVFINIINIKRLQFNILHHEMVPPHRIITQEEVNVVKKRYNIMDNSQFLEISRFDPVAQVIGIRPGQLCEIIRPSKTAVTAKVYRVCV